MDLIVSILAILVTSFIISKLGKKINIPSVVSLIFVGLILGIPFIEAKIIGHYRELIIHIGDIGLLVLMFLAGLESSWRLLCEEKKDASLIAVLGVVVPLFMGYGVFRLLGFSQQISLIIGICMSISAEAVRAKLLFELKKLKTKVGAALIGAGLIDDMIGLSLFVLLTLLIKEGGSKEEILVVASILMFFVGIIFQRILGKKHVLMKHLEKYLNILVVPFFFVSIGMHFDFNSLVVNPLILTLTIFIAILGKLIGTWLCKPFCDFNWPQLHLIGWAMNSRGALEMALALVAFRTQLINLQLYSSLVVMAFVTTLIFPFVIIHMINKKPKIMEVEENGQRSCM